MYALLLELTALLCFWLCLGAWQEEGAASGRRTFVCVALAVFIWNVGILARVEGLAPLEQVHRIAMLGAIPVAGLWVGLALMAADHPLLRRARWLPLALMAPQWLLYATLYMDGIGPYFLAVVNEPDGSTPRVCNRRVDEVAGAIHAEREDMGTIAGA